MSPASSQPEEKFLQAETLWDMGRLYADLASAKREKLTPTEKEHLRGLLLGLGPKEIAQELCKGVGGVRVALCSLYRYLEALRDLPEGEVNSRTAIYVLDEAGYKLSAPRTAPTSAAAQAGGEFDRSQPTLDNPEIRSRSEPSSSLHFPASIVISHSNQNESIGLAQQLSHALKAAGHQLLT